MFDVSIIIVSWNAKEKLRCCLNSLVCREDEYTQDIIVVENGSMDGSMQMVEEEYPSVRLIKNRNNLGFSRANNIGIRSSKGRYLCLINSDVIVLDNCIKNLMSFMKEHPAAGMVGPRIINPDRTLQPSCRHFPTIWNNMCQSLGLNHLFPKSAFFSYWIMDYWNHESIRSVEALSGCFLMVRREAVEEVGLLDENFFIYGEDLDWCKRFHMAGWDIVFYPYADAIHFGSASSANAPIKFYLEMQKADLQYWRKHHGKIGKFSYVIVILLRNVLRVIARGFQYIVWPYRRETVGFKLQRDIACIRLILHI